MSLRVLLLNGATCPTPRPAARRSTSSPSRRGSHRAATTSPSAPLPIPAPCRRRPWPGCATCAEVGTTRSTPGRSAPTPRRGTTWSSTCRTACRSSPGWSPGPRRRARAPRAPRAVAGRLPGRPGAVGWWMERARAVALPAASTSRSAPPRARARSSASTGQRVAVVHNGTDAALTPDAERHPVRASSSGPPGAAQAGGARVDAVVALRERVPGLQLDVVGSGWWEPQLVSRGRAGLDDA